MRLSTKIIVLSVILLFGLTTSGFLTVYAFSGRSSAAPSHLEWVIDENIACLNPSWCPSSGMGLSAIQISAAGFSDHTAFDIVMVTTFSKSGAVLFRSIERDQSVWTIRSGMGSSAYGTRSEFVLTSGSNRTTVYVNGHWITTIRQIHDYPTGVPAVAGSFGCLVVLGVACPDDVSAHLSVTHVTNVSMRGSDSPAIPADLVNPSTGTITWIVSANMGCFNVAFCGPTSSTSGLRSESGTWTLFSNHIAFGVIIGTKFSSSGQVIERYEQHVTATWKIGPTSSGTNDFWIVNGVSSITTFNAKGFQQTTVTLLHDVDTGAPAKQTVFDCSALMGSTCPQDVSAFETVTPA